jgi:hypothetical protein
MMATIKLEFPDSVDMKEWDGLRLPHTVSLMIQAMIAEAVRVGAAERPSVNTPGQEESSSGTTLT